MQQQLISGACCGQKQSVLELTVERKYILDSHLTDPAHIKYYKDKIKMSTKMYKPTIQQNNWLSHDKQIRENNKTPHRDINIHTYIHIH